MNCYRTWFIEPGTINSISDKDEEADITLIKNEYSCFDGYSVKSFSVIDDVAKGCSRASFVDLYNDGNREN